MDENKTEDDYILAFAVRKSIQEYSKANPNDVLNMSAEQVWDFMRAKPVTIEMFTRYMANSSKQLALLIMRIGELERGLLKKEDSDNSGRTSSSGDVGVTGGGSGMAH